MPTQLSGLFTLCQGWGAGLTADQKTLQDRKGLLLIPEPRALRILVLSRPTAQDAGVRLGGLSQLRELGGPSAPPPPPSWDVRVDTRSPHPPALGHDASACFIGLAGQERSKTALVGEAVIYPGETKCGKGHTAARAALAAGGEASAVWMRAAVAVDVIFTPSRLAVHGN